MKRLVLGIAVVLCALAMLLLIGGNASAENPMNVTVSDVADGSFTVTWTTVTSDKQTLEWADVANPGHWNTTQDDNPIMLHRLTAIENVSQSSLFYFRLNSSGGEIFLDNDSDGTQITVSSP